MMFDDLNSPVDAPLKELAEGPYMGLASFLDAKSLCQVDASCKQLKVLNSMLGLWRSLGAWKYSGIELDREGRFEQTAPRPATPLRSLQLAGDCDLQCATLEVDWKKRFGQFKRSTLEFRSPYQGNNITQVKSPDEVIYCRCKLRTDTCRAQSQPKSLEVPALNGSRKSSRGVYLEVDVLGNVDNLSLVLVDFDSGERSSVTFSPDTGAVIRESKTQEEPQRVIGAYIQPLTSNKARFIGKMGLFMQDGNIAFFRKYDKPEPQENGEPRVSRWETTGFIMDIDWAEGRKLTPCLAFRDQGSYNVRLAKLGSEPPIWPKKMRGAYNPMTWTALNWDATV